jgi:hypothetical protein
MQSLNNEHTLFIELFPGFQIGVRGRSKMPQNENLVYEAKLKL